MRSKSPVVLLRQFIRSSRSSGRPCPVSDPMYKSFRQACDAETLIKSSSVAAKFNHIREVTWSAAKVSMRGQQLGPTRESATVQHFDGVGTALDVLQLGLLVELCPCSRPPASPGLVAVRVQEVTYRHSGAGLVAYVVAQGGQQRAAATGHHAMQDLGHAVLRVENWSPSTSTQFSCTPAWRLGRCGRPRLITN